MADSSEGDAGPAPQSRGLIEIDGYRLSTRITGSGTPPVVYLSGLWIDEPGDDYDVDPGSGWHQVLGLLGDTTTSVLYDRAGVGRSDPAPEGRQGGGAMAAADELHQLLTAVEIVTPVVLVGHSLGGLTAESFARAYPRETAGLVSVDGTPREFYREGRKDPLLVEGRGGRKFHMLNDDSATQRYPAPLRIPAVVLASNVDRWRSPPPTRDTDSTSFDELWQGWQRATAARLNAVHVLAHTASHVIHRESPALVAHAVDAVVRAVRERRAQAHLDPRHVHEAGGRLVTG